MKIKINICDAQFLIRTLYEKDTPRSMRIHDSILRQLIEFAKTELPKEEREQFIDYINERYGTK